MSVPDLAELYGLRVELELAKVAGRPDGRKWKRAWRQRERWDPRWEREFTAVLSETHKDVDLSLLARKGQSAYARRGVGRRLKKANPTPDEVAAQLQTQIDKQAFTEGAMAVYLSLGGDESEDSGQLTLDALGLDKTFAWASVRDFAKNVLAVRGSKILDGIYATHLDKLARMVIEKCDPANPKTIGQLTSEIRKEWPALSRSQSARIARTESAFVWETTNWNAMNLNGVEQVEWLIAAGPAIGKSVGPVCKECLEFAARSPYAIEEMVEIPPAHPHCRCTLVPRIDATWLPPAEPWTGSAAPLEVFT